MTYEEIDIAAERLRQQEAAMAPIVPDGFMYSKYRKLENELRQIINDQTVLIRELARNLSPTADGQ
jgi:hypothetical protein